ncbi:xylulokinase [Corynebacterium lubricantis]|uniref:xylulokinase n=1 Tax=Corynebacterium lubricantis TaxID=541095 RepID=UPI000365E241|nr:FGGY family carbohydrate kinase [Corynebacterium lubricantis]
MTVTIGVDVGTQGSKAIVYTTTGLQVGKAYAPHTISYPGPGLAEMDANQLVDATVSAISQAVREATESGINVADIAGIALSGILVGQVLLDEDSRVLYPIITSLDTRSADLAAKAARELEPLWLQESGTSTLDAYAAPFMLGWVRDNEPEIWARVKRTVSVAPFVSARLAGLSQSEMYTEPTHVSGWMVGWDASTGGFSSHQLDAFGIPEDILPPIVPSDSIIGELTSEFANLTGVPAGTPIVAGAGDVMQSNLASGLLRAGQACDSAGTTSILTVGVEGIIPEVTNVPGMLYSNGTLPGQSFYWGYIRAGGLSLRWFRDQVANLAHDEHAYSDFDSLAESEEAGSGGVLFLPYLAGGNPDSPNASGTWLGLHSGTNTGQLWRSALESIAFEYSSYLDVFHRTGTELEEVLVTGGGGNSNVWNSIKASVTGIPWRKPPRVDGPPLANAALANVALGLSESVEKQLMEWTAGGEIVQPNQSDNALYQQVGEIRTGLLRGPMLDVFEQVRNLRKLG